jgi:mRNA-degrading endonuclease RelE of RelBE toxin-antitoxin system
MNYNITIKPKAIKDGKKIPKKNLDNIVERIKTMEDNLKVMLNI